MITHEKKQEYLLKALVKHYSTLVHFYHHNSPFRLVL